MGDMAPHNRGVGLCADYLRHERQCCPVITEAPVLGGKERVDVIGFPKRQPSIVIDWKESQGDAWAHLGRVEGEGKEIVRLPQSGVGQYRYIASMPYVVEWESFGHRWPNWLGLLWYDDGNWREVREALQHDRFNVFAEREILRAYAAKAHYEQRGAVQRQTWLDKAQALILDEGALTASRIAARLKLSMTAHKVALAMENDGRFVQAGPGGPFDVIRKEAKHEVSAR